MWGMQLIDRKFSRDLWAIKGRVFSLVLIIASGVGILFAIGLALDNLQATQDQFLEEKNFADLEVTLLPEDTYNLPDLRQVEGVRHVESRLMLPGRIVLPNQDTLSGLVLFQDQLQQTLNQVQLLEGRPFRVGAQEVVIDKALADYHNYRLGDRVDVKLGQSTFHYTIVGVVRSPEFLITTSNPDYVIAQPGSLGVMWADVGQIREALGYSMVNSLLIAFAEGADARATTDRIMEKLKRTNTEKVTPKSESYSYKKVRMELIAFGVYSPAIVITLCVLSFAMGGITFRRFVLEKQREFGVLAAMGFRQSTVLMALLKLGVLIGLAGSCGGLLIGWGVGWAFAEVYASAMQLPFVVHSFNFSLAVFAAFIGVLSGLISLLIAVLPMLRLLPSQLLMRTANGVFGVRVQGRLNALGVMLRYCVRSLLRDRVLTLSSIVAMGGSLAVAIAYGLAMTSTFGTVERSFDQEYWTHAVDFQYPLYQDETDALRQQADASVAESYFRTAADFRHGDRHAIGILVGLHFPSAMRKMTAAMGRAPVRDDEALISADLARELGIQLNDKLDIGKGTLSRQVTVVGMSNDIYLYTVNVGLSLVQQLAQSEEKVTGFYLKTTEQGAKKLENNTQDVARISNKNELVEHFRKQMEEKMGIVYITILFSVGVSILFVTTLVYLGIAEKRGEYAILRSLGFSVSRLRTLILSGVFIQIALSMLLAVPFAFALVYVLNKQMGEAWFAVDIYTSFSDFLWPMLAASLVAPVVARLGSKAVLNLNIPQFIRGRAI
jgi:putative ABC transport system permease protein